jgi:putative hydrolase of the HAD superfamily
LDFRKKYEHLFFDLDHTLWDYDRNSEEALRELYEEYGFAGWDMDFGAFLEAFHEVNNELWDKFNFGQIERAELRDTRFPIILGKLGIDSSRTPADIGLRYLQIAPQKPHVVPETHRVLDVLKTRYRLHILSNGFDDVQLAKLRHAGLQHYFDQVITSDNSGARKPEVRIFEYALEQAGAHRGNSLFIGDNPKTDIVGARNSGLDHIFFNPNAMPLPYPDTYEIRQLDELLNIL